MHTLILFAAALGLAGATGARAGAFDSLPLSAVRSLARRAAANTAPNHPRAAQATAQDRGCELDDADGYRGRHVHVSAGDAAKLERVAGDPAFAGYRILLAAGTYLLDDVLALQAGQSIAGRQRYEDRDGDNLWDPTNGADPADAAAVFTTPGTETVIDLIHAPVATVTDISQMNPGNALVGIRLGPGNSLERVTVSGGDPAATIASGRKEVTCENGGPAAPSIAVCRVANVVFTRCFTPFGANGSTGRTLNFEFTGNVVSNFIGAGAGSSIELGSGQNGSTMNGAINYNRIIGADDGLLVANYGSSDVTFNLTSVGNALDRNIAGIAIFAGMSLDFLFPAADNYRNRVSWVSVGDQVKRSSNGGITLMAALDYKFPAPGSSDWFGPEMSSGNSVKATLMGTQLFGNQLDPVNPSGALDLWAVPGAFIGPSDASMVGSGNHIELSITGAAGDHPTGVPSIQIVTARRNWTSLSPDNAADFLGLNSGLEFPAITNLDP